MIALILLLHTHVYISMYACAYKCVCMHACMYVCMFCNTPPLSIEVDLGGLASPPHPQYGKTSYAYELRIFRRSRSSRLPLHASVAVQPPSTA